MKIIVQITGADVAPRASSGTAWDMTSFHARVSDDARLDDDVHHAGLSRSSPAAVAAFASAEPVHRETAIGRRFIAPWNMTSTAAP